MGRIKCNVKMIRVFCKLVQMAVFNVVKINVDQMDFFKKTYEVSKF